MPGILSFSGIYRDQQAQSPLKKRLCLFFAYQFFCPSVRNLLHFLSRGHKRVRVERKRVK